MTLQEVLRCGECAAPVKPNAERCAYCGYWLKKPVEPTLLPVYERRNFGKTFPETWLITFSSTVPLYSFMTKLYGTIYRTMGGASVNTGMLPFCIPNRQRAAIVDFYTTKEVPELLFDIEICNISQRLHWPTSTMFYSNKSRPRLPALGISLPGGLQAAFSAYVNQPVQPFSLSVFAVILINRD